MNIAVMRAIVRKDLLVVLRSRAVLLPLVLVPTIVLIVVPLVLVLSGALAGADQMAQDLQPLFEAMPAAVRQDLARYDPTARWVFVTLVYFMAPIYLIVPVIVSSVIAADSFAGEKERRTLEALLHTPTSERELFIAKVAGPWLAGLAVTLGGFVLYAVIANLAGWRFLGRVFFPTPMWWILALWVAPGVAGAALSTMVHISARVRGFQEAFQLGGVVVLPIVVLLVGQLAGVLYFGVLMSVVLGLVFWLLTLVLLWTGTRTFRRSELLTRL